MAETANVMPSLHMPLQSGSDRVLKAMRRSYRSTRYLGIIDRVRAAMPDAAITTDIIVGFPGETEEDFQATLDVVRGVPVRVGVHVPVLAATGHAGRRHGRPGAESRCAGTLRAAGRAAGGDLLGENRTQEGRVLEVLVATGEGRKDAATVAALRPGGGQPAGPLRVPAGSDGPAPGRRGDGPGHLRRAAPPGRRRWRWRVAPTAYAAPGPAMPGSSGRPRPRGAGDTAAAGRSVGLGLPVVRAGA